MTVRIRLHNTADTHDVIRTVQLSDEMRALHERFANELAASGIVAVGFVSLRFEYRDDMAESEGREEETHD